MLLGKIQSGKTRAFLGVIASAFDAGYDIAIVLTKGTKTLSGQTVKRIGRDFKKFIDGDEVFLFDIMAAPEPLTRSELRRKLVIVAKKQVQNLERVQSFFDEKHPALKDKRVLLVDDEADVASLRFVKPKGQEEYDQGKIADQLDRLRDSFEDISFLQVTATPYSLYLQPDSYSQSTKAKGLFYPKKPAFTEVLPVHDAYVGGDHYFGDFGPDSPNAYLFVEVEPEEQDALRSNDRRTICSDRLWTSSNIKALRRSSVTFIVAVSIRRLQQKRAGQPLKKYSMILHNDTQRAAHEWQVDTVTRLINLFEEAVENEDARLHSFVEAAYNDLALSVKAKADYLPALAAVKSATESLISDGELNVQRVNSDVQLDTIIDPETAELRLRAKANIFIGGSILDRGITVPGLLAFYYGRNPKRMQADTVLQHSRMYGARDLSDLAVTRFYTSLGVYERLAQIHALDAALRAALEDGGQDGGVVFIQAGASQQVIACAPSKISLSDVVAVKPNSFLLPTSFDTVGSSALKIAARNIEDLIPSQCVDSLQFEKVDFEVAIRNINEVAKTLVFDKEASFDWDAFNGLFKYYADEAGGQVCILAETGRELTKRASGDKFGLSVIGGRSIRQVVQSPLRTSPALVLIKQVGGSERQWRSGPFWWPVLASPPNAKPGVFATKAAP